MPEEVTIAISRGAESLECERMAKKRGFTECVQLRAIGVITTIATGETRLLLKTY